MTIALLALAASLAAQADTVRFQQGIDYRIEARVEEGSDVLRGRARLRYTNHSSASLDTLWFHQHLNAFRPNSAWARREEAFGNRRFQALGPADHAYERLTSVRVGDRSVTPVYPGAPDSTVVAIPLPAPLRPGEAVSVHLDWDARLSTLPRRQGRRGRHFDFAQWYPRIAVYEASGWKVQPLLPQGEFYGEFGSYDVTLDVAADQVIGATGVPVEGNPGWVPPGGEASYQRGYYPAAEAEALGLLTGTPAQARKRVRWRAARVHHFGWSMNPGFVYEGGSAPRIGGEGEVAIHALFLPTDTAWDDGVVVERTRASLQWLQELFGPYPWPQITNLHRIESGGTEFPMLVMNGSPSEGLIMHEVAHQFVHGVLANNEFLEGWLDEGFASYLDLNYLERERGQVGLWQGDLEAIRALERSRQTQPIATPAADFRDPAIYSRMVYTKGSLVFRMLEGMVGPDTMRAILRELYRRRGPGHFGEADLLAASEAASGRDLDWFFQQWIHTTHTLDYGIGDAAVTRTADGRWRTRVRVLRMGEAWMPVVLQVGNTRRTLESRDRVQMVEVVTPTRPAEVRLDPEEMLLDLDLSNNRRAL